MGWEGVRDEVLRRIRVREWVPGAVIPGEEALAVEFGVARATVNRALRELAEAGYTAPHAAAREAERAAAGEGGRADERA